MHIYRNKKDSLEELLEVKEENLKNDFIEDTSSENWEEEVRNDFKEKKIDTLSLQDKKQENKKIVTDSINN